MVQWASAALSAVCAALATTGITLAIEKLGGTLGGVLGSTPTTIIPSTIGVALALAPVSLEGVVCLFVCLFVFVVCLFVFLFICLFCLFVLVCLFLIVVCCFGFSVVCCRSCPELANRNVHHPTGNAAECHLSLSMARVASHSVLQEPILR